MTPRMIIAPGPERDALSRIMPSDGATKFVAAVECLSRTGVSVKCDANNPDVYLAIWMDGRKSSMDLRNNPHPALNVAACLDYRYRGDAAT
jgi:hypothetical protein